MSEKSNGKQNTEEGARLVKELGVTNYMLFLLPAPPSPAPFI